MAEQTKPRLDFDAAIIPCPGFYIRREGEAYHLWQKQKVDKEPELLRIFLFVEYGGGIGALSAAMRDANEKNEIAAALLAEEKKLQ